MPDWDKDSPRLHENLRAVLRVIRDAAVEREEDGIEANFAQHFRTRETADLFLPLIYPPPETRCPRWRRSAASSSPSSPKP